ncbi:TPA: hypothetical protein I6189_003491 [Vibrio cholerae]|nr:hypothetical protein [Vibrio cholerae]
MTPNQRVLIENSLATIGYVAILVIAFVFFTGVYWVATTAEYVGASVAYKLGAMIRVLLIAGDYERIVFYSALGVTIVAFWLRAFLRAGKSEN